MAAPAAATAAAATSGSTRTPLRRSACPRATPITRCVPAISSGSTPRAAAGMAMRSRATPSACSPTCGKASFQGRRRSATMAWCSSGPGDRGTSIARPRKRAGRNSRETKPSDERVAAHERSRRPRLLALEGAEARTIGLVVKELLHALAAAVFLVDKAQRVALGVEVVRRLRLVHEAHRAQRFLGIAQDTRALLHQLLGKLDRLTLQLGLGIGEVDEPDLLRLLAVEGVAGERVIHAVAEIQSLRDVPRHDAPGQNAPVDFGEAEQRLVRRDREIAGTDLGEAAAEAVAVDHGDGRLREGREPLPAPLIGSMASLRPGRRRVVVGAEIELDVLPGTERFARTGEHEDLGFRIDRELGQCVVHVEVELRAHGIALVRPVPDLPGDAVLLLDQDRLVFLCCHCFLLNSGSIAVFRFERARSRRSGVPPRKIRLRSSPSAWTISTPAPQARCPGRWSKDRTKRPPWSASVVPRAKLPATIRVQP